MTSLIDALLDAPVATGQARTERVTITALSPDSAVVTPNEGGTVAEMPVSSSNELFPWVAGSEFIALRTSTREHDQYSATDPRIVERLFASIVPDIRNGDIIIKATVRRAGARTKIAVASTREGLDPVAALIGRGHNRVDYVKAALGGEQVDVVSWHPEPLVFLANALQPAEVKNVKIDEERQCAYASAPRHQMAAAVGGGGLNASLAAALLGLGSVKISQAD
jgi:transcription antitermination factor NusA-like protein